MAAFRLCAAAKLSCFFSHFLVSDSNTLCGTDDKGSYAINWVMIRTACFGIPVGNVSTCSN